MSAPAKTEAAAHRPRAGTRERLIAAAVELFAESGYEGTSVGEIEAAAGLAPRSGALYKHFASKRELLGAALAERMGAIDRIEDHLTMLPLGDVQAELTLVARLTLEELDRERQLARIVMKDGDRFPEIAAGFHAAVVERGHRLGREWLADRAQKLDVTFADPEATAEVLVNSLVGLMLQDVMFGADRRPLERERIVAAWVGLGRALLEPNPASNKENQ